MNVPCPMCLENPASLPTYCMAINDKCECCYECRQACQDEFDPDEYLADGIDD
jgi:hypothetical protein